MTTPWLFPTRRPLNFITDTSKLLICLATGTSLLILSAVTATSTTVLLVLTTPLLVLFSPVLIPIGLVILLASTGFSLSSGFAVATVSSAAWTYSYVTGKRRVGADRVESVRMKIGGIAESRCFHWFFL